MFFFWIFFLGDEKIISFDYEKVKGLIRFNDIEIIVKYRLYFYIVRFVYSN